MAKTTVWHFEMFKKEAKKWIQFFGMLDWEVMFEHADAGPDTNVAWHSADIDARCLAIGLSTDWKNWPLTIHEVKKSAFHEVIEARFSRLRDLANRRVVAQCDINEEVHAIVQLLTNVIWKDGK